MSFIASKAYVLANGVNYTPGVTAGPIALEESWIMNLHIIGTLTGTVNLITHNGTAISFPIGSLQAGAIYPYSVKSITLIGGDAGKILGLAPGYKVALF
jgi:hypothetical protein